jgi:dTDP-4-amino-4,6-dideoxygalactose transaminase
VLKHFDEVLAHRRAVAQCYIELLRNYDELIFRQDVRDAPWQSFPVLFPSSSAALGWVRNHPARSASVRIANAIRDCIANPSRLQQFAAASRLPDEFTIDALGQRLQELGSAL